MRTGRAQQRDADAGQRRARARADRAAPRGRTAARRPPSPPPSRAISCAPSRWPRKIRAKQRIGHQQQREHHRDQPRGDMLLGAVDEVEVEAELRERRAPPRSASRARRARTVSRRDQRVARACAMPADEEAIGHRPARRHHASWSRITIQVDPQISVTIAERDQHREPGRLRGGRSVMQPLAWARARRDLLVDDKLRR